MNINLYYNSNWPPQITLGEEIVDKCNGGQAMTMGVWLQGALEAMDAGYG